MNIIKKKMYKFIIILHGNHEIFSSDRFSTKNPQILKLNSIHRKCSEYNIIETQSFSFLDLSFSAQKTLAIMGKDGSWWNKLINFYILLFLNSSFLLHFITSHGFFGKINKKKETKWEDLNKTENYLVGPLLILYFLRLTDCKMTSSALVLNKTNVIPVENSHIGVSHKLQILY